MNNNRKPGTLDFFFELLVPVFFLVILTGYFIVSTLVVWNDRWNT